MSSKNRHHEEEEHDEASEAWLLPYSDLMTLLLAVFIVLFAVSKVDTEKAKAISNAFRNISSSYSPLATTGGGESIVGNGVGESIIAGESTTYKDLELLMENINQALIDEELNGLVTFSITDRGLSMCLNDAFLFDPAKAEIKSEHNGIILKIGEILKPLNYYIRIEGHTDNLPINTSIYSSNWELSCARAASIVRFLIHNTGMDDKKISAVGYADSRPVGDNNTPEGRAQNRRVNILVLYEQYNLLEQ